MIPMRIERATHYMGAPEGWDPEKDGECGHLAVRQVGNVFWSLWEPTPGEIELIKQGGSVLLGIVGGQPPVMLAVEPPPPDLKP